MKLLTPPSRAMQRPPHWQDFRVTLEQSAARRITTHIPPALGSGVPREELYLPRDGGPWFTCRGGTGDMYHLRVNFCIHLFWTLPPSLSRFSLIPTSQTQCHPNTRCSEAAPQDTEVQLGCFTSPKPISIQTSLTADGSVFTISCLYPTQGEVQLEMEFC